MTEVHLTALYVAAMPTAKCQNILRETINDKNGQTDMIMSSKQFCVMGVPSKHQEGPVVDKCQGDSGGSAVKMVDVFTELAVMKGWSEAEKESNYMKTVLKNGNIPSRGQLVGVNSWELGCGPETPGVYTRVAEHMNWIAKYTGEMSTIDDKTF